MADAEAEPLTAPGSEQDALSILIAQGTITEDQAEQARRRMRRGKNNVAQALLDLGGIPQEAIYRAIAQERGLPFVNLREEKIDAALFDNAKIPTKVILHYRFVPISLDKTVLKAAFSDAPSSRDLQNLRLLIGLRIQPVVATKIAIDNAIKQHCGLGVETLMEIRKDRDFQRRIDRVTVDSMTETLDETGEDASVSRLFKQFLIEALAMRATDIHIEPFENHIQVRYRVDGILQEVPTPTGLRELHSSIIARCKILANLNIAEHRLPHDGRIKVTVSDEEFDLRVSILPTRFGETLNLRILNRASIFYDLEQLGLAKKQYEMLLHLLELPHGMLLVTGPTGSGKSTTLYAALEKTNKRERKVITVEDPVEYQMDGITQMQMNASIGLTFARGLRSMLRHDPNIILVGEIRDSETAEIAIQAALTGHLVLSTLHTNDSVGSVARLVDMGVEPFLVASSLSATIAQRLARRICSHCKEPVPDDEVSDRIRLEIAASQDIPDVEVKAWRGRGCEECGFTGYHGRLALYEFFLLNEYLQDMVTKGATTVQLRERAIRDGMRVLRMDGWYKVGQGITSIDEILRITTASDVHY